jgi:hypothetical protein
VWNEVDNDLEALFPADAAGMGCSVSGLEPRSTAAVHHALCAGGNDDSTLNLYFSTSLQALRPLFHRQPGPARLSWAEASARSICPRLYVQPSSCCSWEFRYAVASARQHSLLLYSQKPHTMTQLTLKSAGLTPDAFAIVSELDARLADILADAKSSVPQMISRYGFYLRSPWWPSFFASTLLHKREHLLVHESGLRIS